MCERANVIAAKYAYRLFLKTPLPSPKKNIVLPTPSTRLIYVARASCCLNCLLICHPASYTDLFLQNPMNIFYLRTHEIRLRPHRLLVVYII